MGTFLASGRDAVESLVDAVGPRHHLVVGNLRIEQLGRERGLIVAAIVLPILGTVLDGVGQEEHLPAGGAGHRLHASVFQESRLEDTLARDTIIIIRFARRARPDLRDVAVATLHRGKRGFGRYNLPLRVVEQRVRRHVALHVHPLLPSVGLGISEGLVQGTVVEVVLQLVREVGVLGRFVLRPPRETVILLPLALEGLAVAGSCPELRLLQEDGFDALVYDGTDVLLLEVSQIVARRHDVGHEVSVHDGVALLRLLPLVHVPAAVPFSGEVVLILPPGDARHEVRRVVVFAPRLHALGKGMPPVVVHAIDHHGIRADVGCRLPRPSGLERCLLCRSRKHGACDKEQKEEEGFAVHIVCGKSVCRLILRLRG